MSATSRTTFRISGFIAGNTQNTRSARTFSRRRISSYLVTFSDQSLEPRDMTTTCADKSLLRYVRFHFSDVHPTCAYDAHSMRCCCMPTAMESPKIKHSIIPSSDKKRRLHESIAEPPHNLTCYFLAAGAGAGVFFASAFFFGAFFLLAASDFAEAFGGSAANATPVFRAKIVAIANASVLMCILH